MQVTTEPGEIHTRKVLRRPQTSPQTEPRPEAHPASSEGRSAGTRGRLFSLLLLVYLNPWDSQSVQSSHRGTQRCIARAGATREAWFGCGLPWASRRLTGWRLGEDRSTTKPVKGTCVNLCLS